MMPAIKMSTNKHMETHTYKSMSSVHESIENVKLHTAAAINAKFRHTVTDMMMNCIVIACKPVTC